MSRSVGYQGPMQTPRSGWQNRKGNKFSAFQTKSLKNHHKYSQNTDRIQYYVLHQTQNKQHIQSITNTKDKEVRNIPILPSRRTQTGYINTCECQAVYDVYKKQGS